MLDPILVDLREWLRVAEELRLDRNRLSSGVRELLWRYYPQLLELTDDGTAAPPPRFLDLGQLTRRRCLSRQCGHGCIFIQRHWVPIAQ